ncbi:MAG: DNA translocase FtsK 4TM domain-containing protein [Magnetococcales bacterium]|nr:DNA translocase FtsK 4TM domain-containing protein [Magnetococcales bacterium]
MARKKNKSSQQEQKAQELRRTILREGFGVLLLGVTAYLAIALFSYNVQDPSFNNTGNGQVTNLGGVAGAYLADFLLQLFGYSAAWLPLFLGLIAVQSLRRVPWGLHWEQIATLPMLAVVTTILSVLFPPGEVTSIPAGPGGMAGMMVTRALVETLGHWGSLLLLFTLGLLSFMVLTRFSLFAILIGIGSIVTGIVRAIFSRSRPDETSEASLAATTGSMVREGAGAYELEVKANDIPPFRFRDGRLQDQPESSFRDGHGSRFESPDPIHSLPEKDDATNFIADKADDHGMMDLHDVFPRADAVRDGEKLLEQTDWDIDPAPSVVSIDRLDQDRNRSAWIDQDRPDQDRPDREPTVRGSRQEDPDSLLPPFRSEPVRQPIDDPDPSPPSFSDPGRTGEYGSGGGVSEHEDQRQSLASASGNDPRDGEAVYATPRLGPGKFLAPVASLVFDSVDKVAALLKKQDRKQEPDESGPPLFEEPVRPSPRTVPLMRQEPALDDDEDRPLPSRPPFGDSDPDDDGADAFSIRGLSDRRNEQEFSFHEALVSHEEKTSLPSVFALDRSGPATIGEESAPQAFSDETTVREECLAADSLCSGGLPITEAHGRKPTPDEEESWIVAALARQRPVAMVRDETDGTIEREEGPSFSAIRDDLDTDRGPQPDLTPFAAPRRMENERNLVPRDLEEPFDEEEDPGYFVPGREGVAGDPDDPGNEEDSSGCTGDDSLEGKAEEPMEDAPPLPPLDLLEKPTKGAAEVDREYLTQQARLLELKLADFKIKGQITNVLPGPVVTTFEFDPAPGLRASKVITVSDDLARSISSPSVRVVGNIPGKNVIGIEVPNPSRNTVYLREVLESEVFVNTRHPLAVALGSDITGNPVVANLARMPHLLVAGTTGSGKSVALNAMICSILFSARPDQVRFIMVDPKMLELSVYEGIPHLLAPVVTDVHKAANLLKWAVLEMEDRYRLMSEMGVRGLDNFNRRIIQCRETGERPTRRVKIGFDPETGAPVEQDEPIPLVAKPLIVIVIDELADLMIQVGKEVEPAIARLAQMARAAGLHLIVATQRPSVDVITGLIKANFPTRLAFQVSSKIDSRTILDVMGAERLLGMGDGLYLPPGTAHLKRIHAPLVTDNEIHKLVGFLKENHGTSRYDMAVMRHVDEDDDGGDFGPGGSSSDGDALDEYDPLYDQAVALVLKIRKVSTSMVQRHFKIGYNRAARIVERMEADGLVTPSNSAGKREVLPPGNSQ